MMIRKKKANPERIVQTVHNRFGQEHHHQTESFQDEFRRLLKKYEIEFDERYVWD